MVSESSPWPAEWRSWYAVGVLCICAIFSFIDRQIINLLVEDLRRDLGLTDTSISLLQGVAFALFYAACAVPLGRLADVANRKVTIVIGLCVWTLATALCGMAGAFIQLFIARVFVGVGEATLTPNTYSMLADLFRPSRLALPCGVFAGSSFVGSGIALLAGGAILGRLSQSGPLVLPWMGELKTWQAAFVFAAAPGILIAALLTITVTEPLRRGLSAPKHREVPALSDVVTLYRKHVRPFNAVFFGVSLLGAVQFSIGAWAPAYFMRVHGWSPAQIGVVYGVILLIGGTGGAIAGGWLADWWETRKGQGHLRTAMFSAVSTLPFATCFPLVSSPEYAVVLLAPAVFLGSLSLGAGPALLPLVAPPRMRGVLVATYLFIASLLGQALGPALVAVTTDYFFNSPIKVGNSVALITGALLFVAIGFLNAGIRK